MSVKSICIITDRYPTKEYPINTFLDQLVCEFADLGIECTVIAPYSPLLDKLKKNQYHPSLHWVKTTKNGAEINIYCPPILSLLGRKVGFINFAEIYQRQFTNAVKKQLKIIDKEFDIFYAHFISPSGLAAAELGKEMGKQVYIAYGESSLSNVTSNFDIDFVRNTLRNVSGIISVSSKNKEELIQNNVVPSDIIEVFPNSIDTSTFYKMDRKEARVELGIDENAFIVAFVGHFIHRKGSLRVSEAINRLDGVNSFFIGAGELEPTCKGILHSGRLPHDEIVKYLNAADVFVLPTLAEGCCNAIVEAMACGLPVISSNLPFNDDILDESCSIRIDPSSIEELADAIELLKNDTELREKMSEGALSKAKGLTIDQRAKAILRFIEEKRCML